MNDTFKEIDCLAENSAKATRNTYTVKSAFRLLGENHEVCILQSNVSEI
jgi:hypothetical protein